MDQLIEDVFNKNLKLLISNIHTKKVTKKLKCSPKKLKNIKKISYLKENSTKKNIKQQLKNKKII